MKGQGKGSETARKGQEKVKERAMYGPVPLENSACVAGVHTVRPRSQCVGGMLPVQWYYKHLLELPMNYQA